jgi:tetratricopeptide (TPR) repeat protein
MDMRRLIISLVAGFVMATPLSAQIPRSSGQGGVVTAAPKMMVATPYVFASTDSAAAVMLGASFRERLDRVSGRDFQVIPREQMNQALVLWGYPADAILPNNLSNLFAKQLNARTLVSTSMSVEGDGRASTTSRFAGVNDEAGYVVRATQAVGQTTEDFAKDLAEGFKEPIKAYKDAKECMTLARVPDKQRDAVRAAEKALRRVPNHGLAEMCLVTLARAAGEPSDSIVAHLERAIIGDPLSLPAYTALATEFEARGDTTRVIEAFQAMLLIAPTNEALRTNAIKLFNQYGRPDAAVAIADAGIERDPYNRDFYDLKANAHAVAGQMPDALGALAAIYDLDSARVDSAYFKKVIVFAEAAGDTAAVLRFAIAGSARFPDNITLLGHLASAYATAGALDSAVVVTTRLNELDPTTTTAALKTAKALADGRRVAEAIPFADFAAANGTDTERINAATILMSGALPLLQDPRDEEGAATGARRAIELAGDDQPAITRTANYILGLSTFLMVAGLDEETEASKSCEMANQMNTLLVESEAALNAGRETNPEQVDTFLGYVGQYKPRVESMIGAYCD